MSSNQIKSKERAIGKQAAKMAEAYIHQVLRQKLSIRNKGDANNKPILKATKVTAKVGSHRLLGLNLTSSKVGFILNYGFIGTRSAAVVYNAVSKSFYQRGSADVKLDQRKILENVWKESGALDFLGAELLKTRGEDFEIKLNGMITKFNQDGDGRG